MRPRDFPDAGMLRVSAVIGNESEGVWPAKLRNSRIDLLPLDAAEAQRSRIRKHTVGGIDVAVGLERGVQLRDGDVLGWDEASKVAVVVRVSLPDVMVVDLSALVGQPAETLLATSVELGHALGNQHWATVVKGTRVYVPVTVAPTVMTTVLKTHDIDGANCSIAPGAEVLPYLAPHEVPLFFAGIAGHSHAVGDAAIEDKW